MDWMMIKIVMMIALGFTLVVLLLDGIITAISNRLISRKLFKATVDDVSDRVCDYLNTIEHGAFRFDPSWETVKDWTCDSLQANCYRADSEQEMINIIAMSYVEGHKKLRRMHDEADRLMEKARDYTYTVVSNKYPEGRTEHYVSF